MTTILVVGTDVVVDEAVLNTWVEEVTDVAAGSR
jgi:hypothetical protein